MSVEPEARTDGGAEGLAAIRDRPREALIGFDFDGTLSPIVDDPAAPTPPSR